MISNEQVEKALDYLRDTAEDLAQWRSRRVWLEEKKKTIRSHAFLGAEGTVAEREAKARTDEEYLKALDDEREAVHEETLIRARRDAAEAKIEAWRSMEASKRASNV